MDDKNIEKKKQQKMTKHKEVEKTQEISHHSLKRKVPKQERKIGSIKKPKIEFLNKDIKKTDRHDKDIFLSGKQKQHTKHDKAMSLSSKVTKHSSQGTDSSSDSSYSDSSSSSDDINTHASNIKFASVSVKESDDLSNSDNEDSESCSNTEDDVNDSGGESAGDPDVKGDIETQEDEYAAIKKELANIPLEDLMKIKEKLGLKVFRQIMHGGKLEDKKKQKVFKRENKNRPMEMSSKRPVPMKKITEIPKRRIARDPRFDDLSGEYSEEHFQRNYSFLDEVKGKEKLLIQKKLKKTKNETKKKELQFLLDRMNQQEQIAQQKQKQKELESAWKFKERDLVKEGKTPYFLKKADKKKLELAEKFKELQKSGKVEQYLSKKRKKNAQKERKKLPGLQQR